MKIRLKIFTTIFSVLACCGLAFGEANDFVASNTFDGASALANVTSGGFNSAFGWFSLFSNSDAFFNTGAGAGTLAFNNAADNTAVGAGAMLFNTAGIDNTAVGVDALAFNDSENNDTAIGAFAGFNMTGGNNTAVGSLDINSFDGITEGHDNTVVGRNAGGGITSGSDNTIVGGDSGTSFFTLDNNVYIGRHVEPPNGLPFESNTIRIGSGVSGNPSNGSLSACFIDGILANPVPQASGNSIVTIDPVTAQLGVTTDFAANKVAEQEKKIEEQQASIAELKSTIALQAKGMEVLTAQLKEQGVQIQKVSAQLEVNKPAAKVVVNKP